jgi:NADPH-dependent 2,4-dienoyl-CoA reductase/sulfur reductase-like enzyme
MTHDDPVAIVGGGAAGHACVRSYREHGGTAPIMLISADDRLPYFRPELSKAVITGASDPADIALDARAWYESHDVHVELDTEVTAIDTAARILTTTREPVHFRSVVLATGSNASRPDVPGAEHPDVLTLRSAADSERVLSVASAAQRIIVIGSGFVGCELAASLRLRGLDIAMVATESAPQVDRLGDGVGSLLTGWLRDLAVDLRAGASVTEIECGPNGARVWLPDGVTIEADAVVVATGAAPNVGPWRSSGFTGDAVRVDETMASEVAGVFAVGDIAEALHPVAGRHLRVEHWGDAEAMGAVAGAALAGHPVPWRTVPGFWSEVAGRTLKYVAWGDGWDAWHERHSGDGTTFWFERDREVVGVLTVDHDDDLERGRALIERRASIDAI